MLLVGVDENGLGPVLGPLTATAVTIELDAYDAKAMRRVGKRAGIDDSKQVSSFGKMAHAESVVLALVRELTGAVPRDADALLTALSLDGILALRTPCPASTSEQCWREPLALPAFGGEIEHGARALAKLRKKGFVVRRARTAVACVGMLNAEHRAGRNKVQTDLMLFERLLLDARASGGADLRAVCGMIGGIRKYTEYFTLLRETELVDENDLASVYRVPGLGEVAFEIDADDRHTPVALASIIGKYVRELGMERLVRYYHAHDAALPKASGYRDPVTKRFIRETEPIRRRLGIVEECFTRLA